MRLTALCVVFLTCVFAARGAARADDPGNARKPADDAALRDWLQNMVWHHRFTDEEVKAATGLSLDEVAAAKKRLNISADNRPDLARKEGGPLRVLPYPGGRHPRIGFLDGAVDPQRETKVSVFTPWNADHYVVVDVPEALWSNLGLTYLAHTHVPTVWSKQKIDLDKLEWTREKDGSLTLTRKLPSGIAFSTKVVAGTPGQDAVRMSMSLTNGSKEALSDLRVQMCVMLKGAAGFDQLTADNKLLRKPYVAVHDAKKERWIISAWEPCHRPWANPPVPCLHSDPKFPDLKPGESATLRGWLSFYEGKDIEAELKRIEATGWAKE